jgi:hypothetical protein
MAEFAAKNLVLETSRILPLFANYGLNPKIDFEPDMQVDNPEESLAHTLTNHLSEIHNIIKSEISLAQD